MFTGILKREGITISMDGRGRTFGDIFVERLWRAVKYEDYNIVLLKLMALYAFDSLYRLRRSRTSLPRG